MSPDSTPSSDEGFLLGDGEMAVRMRAFAWEATPLGPPATWPQSLRTAIRIMLTSRYAMWMLWGPDLTFFCNDAYFPTLGVKGEWALGSRSDKVWAEIWPDIGPRIDRVLSTGVATWDEGLRLVLERRGFPEETYHTFSYSPLTDNDGLITGMLCVVTEETDRVIGERRLRVLSALGSKLAEVRTRDGVRRALTTSLAEEPHDLPFALIYLLDGPRGGPRLFCAAGLPSGGAAWSGDPAIEDRIRDLGATDSMVIDDLDRRLLGLAGPAGDRPLRQALVLPIAAQGRDEAAAALVVGLNPYRPLDDAFRGFIDLFAGQVAAGFAAADAYEAERLRAERLAELDRAKTAFFSNISHEFRTPLTLILSPLEEVLNGPAGAPGAGDRVLVETAHRNALRLLRLVNALLDFARVEAGRTEAELEATDLARFTADLAGNFRSLCEVAGLTLAVACPPLDREVFVDRDMWEKIVLNLLSNAFKFTFEGGIRVSLGQDEGHAILRVEDTGTGIPAGEVPRLFERFHRVSGARGRTFEGSGIGLALVQDLVKLHSGTIRVDSVPGRGSTFTVMVPLGRETSEHPAFAPAASAPTAVRAEAYVEEARRWLGDAAAQPETRSDLIAADLPPDLTSSRRGRVLLADDNADMRDHVRRLLEGQGYEVEAVPDGLAALAAARLNPPDLLLTDVMMPRLDGFGLLRAVRDDPILRERPVLMLSARAGEEAEANGLEAGADDYLTKPFSARELLARVGANLQLARVRREAADALRRANEGLESEVATRTQERDRVWQNSRDMLVVLTSDGMVKAVNPAWTTLLGLHAADAVGRDIFDFVWPEDRAGSLGALQQAAGEADLTSFENRLTHADGTPRWFSWHTSTEGDLVYAYGREITAEKAQAEALLRAEDQLRQSQKMEAVGQLTGGLAHDFNNLLAGISGSLELMQTRMSQGRVNDIDRYLTAAQGAAKRAAALTHRLLAFSRRQTLDPKPTNVNRLVAGLEELIRRTVGPQITVEVVGAASLWPTLVDSHQLENALLNLCVNARDAMPEGGRMTIETANKWLDERAAREQDMPPGQYLSLCVSDTGTGMAPDIIAKAFDPFFTTKPIGQGTGLGLSMIYGFARQSGGQVRIYSEIGEGTTVCIYLPRFTGEIEPEDLLVTEPGPPKAAPGETVLVVDDEPTVRMLITEVLEDLGYTAIEAGDGPSGLRVLQSETRLDLLVTDVGLPGGMNGRQLADAARVTRPDLKILFITGYAENAAVGNGHLEPGMQVLTKPFVMEVLANRIRDMIESS